MSRRLFGEDREAAGGRSPETPAPGADRFGDARTRGPRFGSHAHRRRAAPIAVVLAVVAVAAVGVGAALASHSVGNLLSAGSAGADPPPPPPPTRLLAMPGRDVADGAAPLRVTLSAPPAYHSPRPTLYPAVAGTWSTTGDTETFTPAGTLAPCSTYRFTVWAHTYAKAHGPLGQRHVLTLHVACPSILGLQEALARLGYLGARLHPRYAVHLPAAGPESLRQAAEHAFRPFHGRLAPDPAGAPPVEAGQLDETTKGALEVFQEDHNLEATGEPSAQTWHLLLVVEGLYHRDPRPYTWVTVSEAEPETLEVHRGDHVAITSAANTGVAGAETAQGIFPIYARYVSTTMSGTNPDGSHYSDPGVPWVNYFNGGDAVHGFVRPGYGYPQSDGCVELPIGTAAQVFPLLQIGDIVWVT